MFKCSLGCPFRPGAKFRGRLSVLTDPQTYAVEYEHYTQTGYHMIGIRKAEAVGSGLAMNLVFCTSIHHPQQPWEGKDDRVDG